VLAGWLAGPGVVGGPSSRHGRCTIREWHGACGVAPGCAEAGRAWQAGTPRHVPAQPQHLSPTNAGFPGAVLQQ
jgi:hypothetical protein